MERTAAQNHKFRGRKKSQMIATPISGRQLKIAELIASGYSNRDIAQELKLTEQVVKNVVHALFDKLGVWNRVELANYFSNGSVPESARLRIERDRINELRRQKILDSSGERIFDELASVAANVFEVPIALVAFADSGRIWFKSCVGLSVSEVPREITLCHHTIQQSKVFIVNDALKDQRFMCSPLVTADPQVRFYAAAPILTENGYALGVVCVVDRVPRCPTPAQTAILQSLARLASEQLEMRCRLIDLKQPVATELVDDQCRLEHSQNDGHANKIVCDDTKRSARDSLSISKLSMPVE